MKILRIIIGSLIGSVISVGMAIGLIYGGIQVAWWLGLVLCIVGFIAGGFVAGFISQDKFPGTISGIIVGIITFVGIFLFFWLIIKAKIIAWSATLNISEIITELLNFLGVNPTSSLGIWITNKLNEQYTSLGTIEALVQTYVPKFTLLLGSIFGGIAFLIAAIAGRIGGRLNKIDEIVGD
jgi:hypothetical protein